MKCTFLANCGLLIAGKHSSLLVDAPNGVIEGFDTTSCEDLRAMTYAEKPYDNLCGILFTHLHPDHYDENRLLEVLRGRENIAVYRPTAGEETGLFTVGDFTIRYFSVPHSGGSTYATEHRTFLIECAGRRLYISGDAEPQSEVHRRVLEEYAPHVAVWNPNYVNFSRGRELLPLTEKNYICHLPIVSQDSLGIKRKCLHTFAEFSKDLTNTICVLERNFTINI